MATVEQSPPTRSAAQEANESQYIDAQIRRTSQALKLVDLTTGLITLVIGILAYLLAAAVLDHWIVPGGLGSVTRTALFVALAVAVGWYCWRTFVPLARPISSVYAAHAIEQGGGSLKNSLLNLLLLRGESRRISARVFDAIEKQAAQRLSQTPIDSAVDRTSMLRAGYVLVAVLTVCAIYAILSPKDLAVSAGRVLVPWSEMPAPSRVQIFNVNPGDYSIARGERVTVSAEVTGAREDEVAVLRFSSADGQQRDEFATMQRTADGLRFELPLPPPGGRGGSIGVQQDLEYWIEAGDARTKHFKVSVFDKPTIVVQRIRYEYPAYTGLPSLTTENSGDIRAVEGTTVTLQALANQPIDSASVDFNADGRSDLRMRVDGDQAIASFTLSLQDDRRTPEHGSYVLRFVTNEGRKNQDPAKYQIDVTPDYAPEVRVTAPVETEVDLRVDETLLISVESRDPDFALSRVELVGQVGGREMQISQLLTNNFVERFNGSYAFSPSAHDLKPGDVVEYWARALDNRQPTANMAFSERRRIRIVGGTGRNQGRNERQQDEQQQNGGSNEDQQSGGSGEDSGGAQGGAGGEGEQSDDAESQSDSGGQGESGEASSDQSDSQSGNGGEGGQGDQQSESSGEGNANSSNSSGQRQSDGQQENQTDEAEANNGSNETSRQSNQGQADANRSPSDASASDSQDDAQQRQERVSPDGDDDASAFKRIKEYLDQQDGGQSQGDQTGESADGQRGSDDAQRRDGQSQSDGGDAEGQQQSDGPRDVAGAEGDSSSDGQPREREDDGTNSSEADSSAEAADTADQGSETGESTDADAATQQGRQADAASDPSASDNQGRGDQQSDPQGEQGESSPGGENQEGPDANAGENQGDGGAGSNDSNDQGVPEPNNANSGREKSSDESDRSDQIQDTEPPASAESRRESDSQGDQQGDQAGGGGRGGGQASDEQGTGASGENQPADRGGGAAPEQGDGPTGQKAGQDQQADGQTGQSSGDQRGEGSESAQSQADRPNSESGNQTNDSSAQSNPSDAANEADGNQGDQRGSQNDPSNSQQQSANKQDGQQNDNSSNPNNREGGSAAGSPTSGGNAAGNTPSPSGNKLLPGDEANLEFARKQTDFVVERLADQLAKDKVDPDLLDKLGWTKDELRQFVDRWKDLRQRATASGDAGEKARRDISDTLKNLDALGQNRRQRFRVQGNADDARNLNSGFRQQWPSQYRDAIRNYSRDISSTDDKSDR